MTTAPLLLASASPRRRELLATWAVPFEVCAADVAEWEPRSADAVLVASENARRKCRAICELHPTRRVLAADTVVALPASQEGGSEVLLAKPTDPDDALRMLHALSGRQHRVVTAVALGEPGTPMRERVAIAIVRFRALSDIEISSYLASGEWQGKAGAYAIQGRAEEFVSHLDGERDAVIGLSRIAVFELLEELACEESAPEEWA